MNTRLKEADPRSVPEPVLVPERAPKNSFVRFLDERRELFDQFGAQKQAVQAEENGWRASPSLDPLLDRPMGIIIAVRAGEASGGWSREGVSAREQKRAIAHGRKSVAARIFGKRARVDLEHFGVNVPWYQRRMSHEERQTMQDAFASLNAFTDAFSQAMAAVEEPFQATKTASFSDFANHLQQEPVHFFDFAVFLANPAYQEERKHIRPFLSELVTEEEKARRERQDNMLGGIQRQWVEKLRENPDDYTIRSFLESEIDPSQIPGEVKDGQAIAERNSRLIELFIFGLEIARKIDPQLKELDVRKLDIEAAMRLLPPFHLWPTSLKQDFNRFVTFDYTALLASMRKSLEPYRQEALSSEGEIVFQQPIFPATKRKRQQEAAPHEIPTQEQKGEEVKRPIFILGEIVSEGKKLTVREIDQKQIRKLVAKVAEKRAKGDARVVQDIEDSLASLQEDPYGLGTEVLSDRHVASLLLISLIHCTVLIRVSGQG